MSNIYNEMLLEKWYEEALAETLKEYKDVAKAEEEAEKIARDRLESDPYILYYHECADSESP